MNNNIKNNLGIHLRNILTIASWGLYDFANTMFSMNIVTLYFALWIVIEKGGQDIYYSLALSTSMIIAAILEPILGAVSDKQKSKMPYLVFFTILCCIFTGMIRISDSLLWGLIFFSVANLAYQVGAIFYNALLFDVSKSFDVGRISGVGVSLGYIGAITGMILVKPFVLSYGYRAAFIPTAIYFFLFALPCFLFVKEREQNKINLSDFLNLSIFKSAFLRIKQTFIDTKSFPGLRTFIIASFIFLNAVSTVIIFMAIYTKKVMGFSDSEIHTFFIMSTIFAAAGSIIFGVVTDKLGSLKATKFMLKIWMLSLGLAAVSFNKLCFWFIGPLIGISLGTTWVSTRALAIHLCPKEKVGEIFGLLGLTGKSSAIIGPLVWGVVVWAFGSLGILKYRIAILVQLLFIYLGYKIIKKITCIR
ncbi:MAG: MFS transporter [Candidatus Omnitrophota bacterium]